MGMEPLRRLLGTRRMSFCLRGPPEAISTNFSEMDAWMVLLRQSSLVLETNEVTEPGLLTVAQPASPGNPRF